MAHEQTANKVALVQSSAIMHGEVHVGMHKGKMHIFVQGQFTGGEIHKLKIQILEGKMSKVGLQKLTVLLYTPLLPPLVAPSSSRDHERRGSARAPALQALTPKLGI